MIPIKLTLEGIYSYQKSQTIDFTRLTEAGLFGIFGSVGSGKSSILEAISFALYGETERLNARDSRAYNMMNLKSNRAYIEFDFLNHENKTFRISREFKRNSKKFEDVKSSSTVFYEKSGAEWKPLGHTNVETILGLTYNNFKRTIIIPQGQFKEFLELKPTERTTMLMEIFNLHKYDLGFKTKNLIDKNKSDLDLLIGKLSGYEEVSSEKLSELEIFLKEELNNLQNTKKKHRQIAEEYQRLETLKEEFNARKINLEKLKTLEEKSEANKEKKRQLEKFEETHFEFSNLLKEKETFENEIHHKSKELESAKRNSEELGTKLKKKQEEIEKLKPEFDKLISRKEQENDYDILLNLKELRENISKAKNRLAKGKLFVEEEEKNEKTRKEEQKEIKKYIEELKKSRLDSDFLITISNWYQKNETLQNQYRSKQKNGEELQEKIKYFDAELNNLKINPISYLVDFELERKKLTDRKIKLQEKEAQLKVQQKLGEFAHTLVDGQPCLLCGSIEHPKVYVTEDISAEMATLIAEIKNIEDQLQFLINKENKVERILSTRKIYQDQIHQEKAEIEDLINQISQHKSDFIWREFDPENVELFNLKRIKSAEIEREIDEKEKELKSLDEKLVEIEKRLDTYENELQKLKREVVLLEADYNSKNANLKQLKSEDFDEFDRLKLEELHRELKIENQRIETGFQNAEKKRQELEVENATVTAQLNAIKKHLFDTNKKLNSLLLKITENLDLHRFNSIEEVQEILNLQLNPAIIRQEIQSFEVAYTSLKNKISEQNEKLKDFELDEEVFEAKKDEFEASTKELDEINKKSIQTETEFNRLQKSFEEKRELLELRIQLEKRAENLEILRRMFSGQGFVQYVSGIYLRQLCDNANIRFHRMTRNQLSLQVNEKLEFEIVDYLNEGRTRSVKTLSGGQSFQISLSLALALAENVQNFVRSDKNFFFIDEGFGTLDVESVNIVFETLLQLQKENRMVGIISHVEELKEKMPVAIQVRKHEEKGSLIEFV